MPDETTSADVRTLRPATKFYLAGLLLVSAGAVSIAGYNHLHVIEVDSIAYMQTARYYVEGRTDVMLTGYWDPMFSWLMAALLPVVENTFVAARIVMGASALLFTIGGALLLRRLELPDSVVALGATILALAGLAWSVTPIQPDMLAAGFFCMGTGLLLSRRWEASRKTQIAAGVLFALGYFSKGASLPLMGMMSLCLVGLWLLRRREEYPQAIKAFLFTVVTFGVLALPWITALSMKYGKFTMSTKGKITFAVLGPPDKERWFPTFREFHVPEEGRMTSWEDPTTMSYNYWSPFDSPEYMKHQLVRMYRNFNKIMGYVGEWDWFYLSTFCLVAGFLVHAPWRQNLVDQRWRLAALPVLCILAMHIPVVAKNMRYFWATLPFLVAATGGMVLWLAGQFPESRSRFLRLAAFALVAVSFTVPHLPPVAKALINKDPEPDFSILADKLLENDLHGTLADNSGSGLFVCHITRAPSYGFMPEPTTDDFAKSGAELALVMRRAAIADELAADPRFESLDDELFDSPAEAERFSMKIFRNVEVKQTSP